MGVSKCFDSLTYKLNTKLRAALVWTAELKNIKKKQKLWSSVVLTDEQEKRISCFFQSHYGKNYSNKWHKLYQSYTGIFCEDYFPEILFSTKLEPMLNNYHEANFLGDKNLLECLFAEAKTSVYVPKTYASCVRGIIRNGSCNFNTKEEVKRILDNVGKCVVKKTVDTSSGRDVQICEFLNGIDILSNNTIEQVLEKFGSNWVVQEVIKQNDSLSKLNSSSVNTFRVISYVCKGRLFTCPVALRMGQSNANRDNIHYGGIVVGIKENGCLKQMAFSEYGEKFLSHPDSHILFDNYSVLPGGTKQLTECAEKLHSMVPQLGIISWDLTIDDKGRVVLIEMNTTGQSAWFCQMVNGEPLFGDNTGAMLEIIR